jgi:hypothetical protein
MLIHCIWEEKGREKEATQKKGYSREREQFPFTISPSALHGRRYTHTHSTVHGNRTRTIFISCRCNNQWKKLHGSWILNKRGSIIKPVDHLQKYMGWEKYVCTFVLIFKL